MLPPIIRPPSPLPPPPVATFFNVPRRYVRSNMPGDTPSSSLADETKPSRSLRKSSRIHDARSAPTSNPVQRTKEEELPSPSVTSPRSTRKRLASLDEAMNGDDFVDACSPIDSRSPRSATSTGSGETSPHVCLCQPEPKIPRPRNGELPASLSSKFLHP
jgi:hypothetical protein